MNNKIYSENTTLDTTTKPLSNLSSTTDLKQLALFVLLIPIGIMALSLCLSLGGLYALIGPWIILAITVVVTKRLK